MGHHQGIIACQKVLKDPIKVLDNSEKKNICLGVKKPAIQVPNLTASILILRISQPAGCGASLSTIISGRVFVNNQDTNMHDKFIIADNEI